MTASFACCLYCLCGGKVNKIAEQTSEQGVNAEQMSGMGKKAAKTPKLPTFCVENVENTTRCADMRHLSLQNWHFFLRQKT